ncbi:MAG: hypothetical protein ACRDY1_06030 [Acidimicrobiales bacterium]
MSRPTAGPDVSARRLGPDGLAIAFVEAGDDDGWATTVQGEAGPSGSSSITWPPGHTLMTGWLDGARRGDDITTTAADIDAENARHARHARRTRR